VYTCHSLAFEEYISRNERPDSWLRRLLYWLHIEARKRIERKSLENSDTITVLSDFTKEKLWNAYRIPSQKISVIPGGVDLERFQPGKDQVVIRQRLGVPTDKFVLFTVRNLVQRMGLENLILALHEVASKHPDIYLVIGGTGPLQETLAAMITNLKLEKNIRLAGFIPEGELADYYRMADFFILPTIELEGFGLITLEALASGLPVLGTPVGGTTEILSALNPSLLFKNTDPQSMAALIAEYYEKIRNNPEVLGELSRECRQYAESNYSWERNVISLEKLLSAP
jgi:glycosyltransferase involved in cell wall biosynthesis